MNKELLERLKEHENKYNERINVLRNIIGTKNEVASQCFDYLMDEKIIEDDIDCMIFMCNNMSIDEVEKNYLIRILNAVFNVMQRIRYEHSIGNMVVHIDKLDKETLEYVMKLENRKNLY